MDLIVFIFVAVMCVGVAIKIFNSEGRNQIFNKRAIEVTDVQKYNKYCGILTLAFGAVAELTMIAGAVFGGWVNVFCTFLLIVEAILVLAIYDKIERKMLKKR